MKTPALIPMFKKSLGAVSHALLACSPLSAALALALWAPALRAEQGHDHSGHDHAGHGHADHGKAAEGKPAHAGHDHAGPDTTGPAMTVSEGLASLRKHLVEMEQELAAEKPEGFHGHDDAVQLAVRGFERDSTLDAGKRKRVQGYVKNVRRLAHKIHHQAEGKKFAAARKELAKLKAQVDLLEKQFVASPAAPATPAKSAPAAP